MQGTLSEQLAEALENDPVETEESADAVGENEETQDEFAEEEAGGEIHNLADLARENEWDVDELYALEVEMPDGAEPVALGKVKDEITNVRRQAATLQQKVQEQSAMLQQAQAAQQQGQQVDQAVMQAQGEVQALNMQAQSVNWQELEKEDPGKAALMRQKFSEAIGVAQQKVGYAEQQSQQRNAYQSQQQLAQGQQYLHQHIPEWNDAGVAKTERQEIAQMLVNEGYNPNDVGRIADPIAVKLARELVSLRKQVAGGRKAAEQVRQSPQKSLRGGKLGNKSLTRERKLTERAKSTGSKNDTLAAARAILGI